ncbi:MAG TPA: LysM domain-containing protein [Marmoricola sp.]|jgi:nucleoid-associated protein YgaU|nr:LysM domain-containing protein [Marmoricola sp.]
MILGQNASFDVLLVRTALVALGAAMVWGLAVLIAIALESLTSGRVRLARAIGCPPGWHRWLLTVAGAVLAAGVATSAPAVAAEHQPRGGAGSDSSNVLDGLELPDRTVGGVAPQTHPQSLPKAAQGTPRNAQVFGDIHRPRARPHGSVSAWVTVRSGESLWEISRQRLPADATPEQIAAYAASLYQHNRSSIGQDPDLIRPGQRLAVPAPHETYSEDS